VLGSFLMLLIHSDPMMETSRYSSSLKPETHSLPHLPLGFMLWWGKHICKLVTVIALNTKYQTRAKKKLLSTNSFLTMTLLLFWLFFVAI